VKPIEAARSWGRMVKFAHSIFALPFALSGAALAAAEVGITWWEVFWIVVAMVCARNAAMGFNRLADHRLDALNPRTAGRELPRGALSRGSVWAFTVALSAGLIFAAFMLNPLCGWLSPVALAIVFGYSFTKRFTWASHLVLGLALAVAPVGGWLAVSGRFSWVAWLLGLAVLLWVAGFDIVYACQDVEFDRCSVSRPASAYRERCGSRARATPPRSLRWPPWVGSRGFTRSTGSVGWRSAPCWSGNTGWFAPTTCPASESLFST